MYNLHTMCKGGEAMEDIRENKERHNIMLKPSSWKILKELKKVQGKSASEIIEHALWSLIKTEGYNSMYFKIMATTEPCDPEENEELTRILDQMTEEDLKVVRRYELHR